MADLVKKIKIKKQDGTFTDYIPIGAESKNVNMNNNYSVQDNIGDINLLEDGNVAQQLGKINHVSSLSIIDYGAKPDNEDFDNSIAIQSCIDDCLRLGKTVYIPAGTFYIKKPLKIYGKGGNYSKASIIRGELKGLSVIIKNTNESLNNNLEYDEDAIFLLCNSSAVNDDEYISGSGASGFYIDNLTLKGTKNIKPKYGIYAAHSITTSGMNIKDVHIVYCSEGCLCLFGSTYLSRIENVRVDRAQYGMHIHDGVNTSLNIVNCYAMGCRIGYYIGGIYMTMNCCCGDWCTEKVFDLENYRGSLISPGSESAGADYCFYFRASNVTVTGAYTFGNFTEEEAAHIYVGWSTVVFVGGTLMVSNSSTKKTAPGYFIKRDTFGTITFFNTLLDGYYTKGKGDTGEPEEVQTYLDHGIISYRDGQSLPYIGYDKRKEKTDKMGIIAQNEYLGGNALLFDLSGRLDINENGKYVGWGKGTARGDIVLYKDSSITGALGVVQTDTAENTTFANGKYISIPVAMIGTTQERPKDPQKGICYFDTTLNKPIWCTARGKVAEKRLTWDTSTYIPPEQNITLTMTIEGNTKEINIPADTSLDELGWMIVKPWFNTAKDYGFYVTRKSPQQVIIRAVSTDLPLNNISFSINGADASTILQYTVSTGTSMGLPTWADATGTVV